MLSRLLGVICTVTFVLVSLPSNAGIGDKDLPLILGQKVKLLYTVTGVRDSATMATSFHCTSTEKAGGNSIVVGIEIFNYDGVLANDVTLGDGEVTASPGRTVTLSTSNTAVFAEDNTINATNIDQGSARIMSDSKNLVCSAMIVDVVNNPPESMVMLPVIRTTKQKGM